MSANLPPSDQDAERAVLSCVLLAGQASQAEVDVLLRELRPALFYNPAHQTILAALAEMRGGEPQHVVDIVTLAGWLKGQGKLDEVGGYVYLSSILETEFSVCNFKGYLDTLRTFHLRRWTLAKSVRMAEMSGANALTAADVREDLAEILDASKRLDGASRPSIQLWTVAEAQSWKPDPNTFLLGDGVLTRGEFAVIAGPPGVGKSRLARTFATAGARGTGEWMRYPIPRKFKSLVLQSEDSPGRLHAEAEKLDAALCEQYVRWSLPCFMEFSNPRFRLELRRVWDAWPFDVLIVDNLNDVAKADGREDYLDALENIWAALPPHPDTPAVIMLAHLRKSRGGEDGRPKTGRQLLDELSGSFAIGAKARTTFVLLPASRDPEDGRCVFECAKSNNFKPLPRSAWQRDTAAFHPIVDFDWDAYDSPPEESRKVVTAEILAEVFAGGKGLHRKLAVKELMSLGFAQPTAYRALELEGGKFSANLEERNGLIFWRL